MTDLLQTLSILCPNAPVELRIIRPKLLTRRFPTHSAAVTWARQQQSAAEAIYTVMNPFDVTKIKKDAVDDDAITRRHWLLVDADTEREQGTNSTEEELAAGWSLANKIKTYLTEVGWPLPVEACSGNGAHLLYRIDLPNDDASHSIVKGILEYLGKTFDTPQAHVDQRVANAARITKLYGTPTRKGPATPERPQRLSALTSVPSALSTVALADLQKIARLAKPVKAPETKPKALYDIPFVLSKLTVYSSERNEDVTQYQIKCPWSNTHSKVIEGRDGSMLTVGDDGAMGYICAHHHCKDRHWEDLRDFVGIQQKPAEDFTRETKKKDGVSYSYIVPNHQDNIRIACERLKKHLTYNEFSDKLLLGGQPLEDRELDSVWLTIDRVFRFRPSYEFFERVIKNIAWAHPFHPVKDYLATLAWDHVPRLDAWLINCAGAEDTDYIRAVSSLVLIAAVKRIREPGCKYDEMLVLECGQGLNKSSALRALCPHPDWFSDHFPLNVDAKQLIEHTLGKWIVEAAELAGKRKAEVEALKSTLSRQVDGPVRLAYAHLPVERRRQFVVIGTTNSTAYLIDSTGARRFWPVKVVAFDVAKVLAIRDQLWAEAAHREAAGESIRLKKELWPNAEAEQEKRREIDAWEDLIRKMLLETGRNTDGLIRVATQALWASVGVLKDRQDRTGSVRITDIMQRLGFRRTHVRVDNVVQVGFIGEGKGLELVAEDGLIREPGEDDVVEIEEERVHLREDVPF